MNTIAPQTTQRSKTSRLHRAVAMVTRNARLILLMGVVVTPPLWITFTYLRISGSAGIEDYGAFKNVNLKAMGNFRFDEVNGTCNDVPPIYRELDGQRVLLIGQMYSDTSASPMVDHFQLVYSIQNCCFNGPPLVQERVFAHVSGDKVPLLDGLARVKGVLHVRDIRNGGRITSLYDLDVESVEAER
jgi:hypothetical protein